jgi:hypothetical protein
MSSHKMRNDTDAGYFKNSICRRISKSSVGEAKEER